MDDYLSCLIRTFALARASDVEGLMLRQFGPLWIHQLFHYVPQMFYSCAVQHRMLHQCVVRHEGALSVLNMRAPSTCSPDHAPLR
jgi:hypothetical protein